LAVAARGAVVLSCFVPLRHPHSFPTRRSSDLYPVIPFAINKAIVYDFAIFSGNSGGPVYFSEKGRVYNDTLHLDKEINFIAGLRSEEHTSELQSRENLVCRLLLEKKK